MSSLCLAEDRLSERRAEAAYVPQARFRVMGSGLNPADSKFIEREVKALLAM